MFPKLIQNSLLFFLLCDAGESKIFEGIPKQAECKYYNPDLIANFTFTYKPLGWKKAKYSIDGYMKEGVEIDNAVIRGTTYRRESNMEYRVFGPKELTVEACGFLGGSWTHVVVDLVAAYMKRAAKSNNVFHPCPFSGHFYIHDLIVDENAYNVVNFLPSGFFMFKARVFTRRNNTEHLLIETATYVDLRPVGIHTKR
ncbi:uncharacterized protein LOC129572465 [Sitodiplosis mosellana]|uniref:uncharacterized protein LOC129572465 n=1 Tax=Sitodiplosis mosellana TaxID=263140 RepID=UPI002444E66E|nr:uncharacterized protein LOC129572465 [Sitodiplosis mosellana]